MHFTTTALLALFLIYNAADAADYEADTAAHGNWDPIKHVVKIEESLNIKSKTTVEVGRYELAEEPVLVQFDRQSCSKDGLKEPFRSGTQQSQPAFNVTRRIASDGNKAPFIYLAKYDPCPEGSVSVGGVYDRDKGTPDKDRVYEKTECPACECKKDSALP
ncbi:hypothetical protein AAVH_11631 [Aphelenchoides avenae]|nr:hypothetical protein AAVH_11631 [Aphelenchus avenae]